MRRFIVFMFVIFIFVSGCSRLNEKAKGSSMKEKVSDAAKREAPLSLQELEKKEKVKGDDESLKDLYITVNEETLRVNLYDNQTVKELLNILPMTVTMDDLHRNEKFLYLNRDLTAQSMPIQEIQKGDLMLYGTNCLVLFYKDIPTTYQYTPLGKVENAITIDEIVGSESIQITFEMR